MNDIVEEQKQKTMEIYVTVSYDDDVLVVFHSDYEENPHMTKLDISIPYIYVLVSSKMNELTCSVEVEYNYFDTVDEAKEMIRIKINTQLKAYKSKPIEWDEGVYFDNSFNHTDYTIINLSNYFIK